jgi:hypothetical protein
MDRTNEDDFNIQYQRHLDEGRLENAMAMNADTNRGCNHKIGQFFFWPK